MHNVEAVEVFDGIGQIVEHAAGVSLRVSVGRGDGIEQISPLWTNPDGRVGCQCWEQCHGSLFDVFTRREPDRFTSELSQLLLFSAETF